MYVNFTVSLFPFIYIQVEFSRSLLEYYIVNKFGRCYETNHYYYSPSISHRRHFSEREKKSEFFVFL